MKRSFIILALVLAAVLAIGAIVVAVSAYRDGDFAALYDDGRAIRESGGGTLRMGGISTMHNGVMKSRVKLASGIFDVWRCSSAQTVRIEINLEVTKGRAKLVWCEEGRALFTLIECAGEALTYAATLTANAPAEIRLVCDGAAYSLEMTADAGVLTTP